MQKILIIIIVFFTGFTTIAQSSIIGRWRPFKIEYIKSDGNETTTMYQQNKNDSIKELLLQKYLAGASSNDKEPIDRLGFKRKMNKDFAYYKSARMVINKDSTFSMKNLGLIMPVTITESHFKDRFSGTWAIINNTFLKFTIANKKESRNLFYKIFEVANDKLIIGQTSEDYKELFYKIEFIPQ